MKWARHVACMREIVNAYKIFVGKCRHKWEDNITWSSGKK
jgi:hypothetical protein